MIRFFILSQLVFIVSIFNSVAQVKATTELELKRYLEEKLEMKNTSLLKNLSAKNIGPSIMSGRVTAIDVNPKSAKNFMLLMQPEGYGTLVTMVRHLNL